MSIYSLTNTTFDISNEPNDYENKDSPRHLGLFKADFGPLAGMMCLGYYLHNCVIPILRNAANPKKNSRDMFIGYFLVFLSYTIVGIVGYIGFSGSKFNKDIESNSLLMFGPTELLPIIVRLASFFQMFTVFPILFHILREMVSSLIYKTPELSVKAGLFFNLVFIVVTTFIGIFVPKVGSILGKAGAISGLMMMYILPIIVHLKRQAIFIKDPSLGLALDQNRIKTIGEAHDTPKIGVVQRISK